MSTLRKEALAIFKQLHRTRLRLFDGDEPNLAKARAKINEEFHLRKHLQSKEEIREFIDVAKEVELFYRTNVIQAVRTEGGTMRLKIHEDTEKLDNIPYVDGGATVIDVTPNDKSSQCCQNKNTKKT